MKGNGITLEKTEGYISTSIITKSRKVTEDVEANDQSTTTYKSVSFKNLWIKKVRRNKLLSETEILVAGLERKKISSDITTILCEKKLCSRHVNTDLGRKCFLKYFFPQFQRCVCTHLSDITIGGRWWS